MASVLQLADLTDQGILVELKLPLSSKRLDVLITGSNPTTGDAAVIVELKQWTEVGRSNITDCVDRRLRRPPARPPPPVAPGRPVPALPASTRTRRSPTARSPSTPAPTSTTRSTTRSRRSTTPTSRRSSRRTRPSPATSATPSRPSSTSASSARTTARSSTGSPATAFKPHKRLLDHVARVIRNEPAFTLLDEQLVAYNAILDEVRGAGQNQQQVVFLVEGGPGTGKSVIAVNLVAELADAGLSTLHVTGSKAFTENLRKIVGGRASALFKYFRDTATVTEPLDVVILDEAHRIRSVSTSRFTPAKARTGKAQIDDILDASRVSVFFIDDLQVVRPGEVGSTDLIREAAAQARARGPRVRARGAVPRRTAPTRSSSGSTTRSSSTGRRRSSGRWTTSSTSGSSASSRELERLIRAQGSGGRDRPTRRRLLLALVGPGRRRHARARRQGRGLVDALERQGRGAAGSARASRSPTSGRATPEGIDQVGCVYTAQGFEFDYVGVIFGPDLVYRPMDGGWVGQRERVAATASSAAASPTRSSPRFVKSTYRVLLTRGLRGCYVYFMDAPTRDFVLSRTERERPHAGEGRRTPAAV